MRTDVHRPNPRRPGRTPTRARCGSPPPRGPAHASSLSALARACGLSLAIACAPGTQAGAGNLTSPEELAQVRELVALNVEPLAQRHAALVVASQRPWRWGSVSGEFVTTLDGLKKRCHPASDSKQIDYLKNGAPDAYAKVLGYLTESQPDPMRVEEARARVLDLVDTRGFHGLLGNDLSASNQCVLDLALSIPVWIETAILLEATPVWTLADRRAFAEWLASQVYPRVAWASRVRRNNWGAAGSASASLIAGYVDGEVSTLAEPGLPERRALTPAEALREHDAIQLDRIGTVWRGDSGCSQVGIQPHGGIPDELRRGSAGCDARFLPDGDDASHTYQTMHVELLVLHAEAQRRRGKTNLFDAALANGTPALLQSILFVIGNPTPGGRSWPWGTRSGTLAVAYRYYNDSRIRRELDRDDASQERGGRTLPYAMLQPMRAEPRSLSTD
jgi:hypothetical protein